MRVFSLATLHALAVLALSACGSSSPTPPPEPTVAIGTSLSPDGFMYPSPPGGYGHSARLGTTPGSIMQNFKFYGYRNGDTSSGLQVISLADYYDPCSKHLSLLRLSVAAVWCVPCNEETDTIVSEKATLDSEGVVIIQALGDGPTMGVGATEMDLTGWITTHKSNFTEMLDPGLANLGSFFDASAIPWNCDIDPRTMEILQAATGWSGNLDQDLALPRAEVGAKPAYPIPVTCN